LHRPKGILNITIMMHEQKVTRPKGKGGKLNHPLDYHSRLPMAPSSFVLKNSTLQIGNLKRYLKSKLIEHL
jgi:hypothetical protein